jgi:hypothetical protein
VSTQIVQARQNADSDEWYGTGIKPDEVARLNEQYGWTKYRVVDAPDQPDADR